MTDELIRKLESGDTLTDDEIAALSPEQLALYLITESDEEFHQNYMTGDDIDFEALASDLGLSLAQVSA
jgi:hypothetical protein